MIEGSRQVLDIISRGNTPQLPELAFDMVDLAPEDKQKHIRSIIEMAVAIFARVDNALPELLDRPALWRGISLPDKGRDVLRIELPEYFIRLHRLHAHQSLGYHRHGMTDVYGIKGGSYLMDVGFNGAAEQQPRKDINGLQIGKGSVYAMCRDSWHQVRHQTQTSLSLGIKMKSNPGASSSRDPGRFNMNDGDILILIREFQQAIQTP